MGCAHYKNIFWSHLFGTAKTNWINELTTSVRRFLSLSKAMPLINDDIWLMKAGISVICSHNCLCFHVENNCSVNFSRPFLLHGTTVLGNHSAIKPACAALRSWMMSCNYPALTHDQQVRLNDSLPGKQSIANLNVTSSSFKVEIDTATQMSTGEQGDDGTVRYFSTTHPPHIMCKDIITSSRWRLKDACRSKGAIKPGSHFTAKPTRKRIQHAKNGTTAF